MPRLCLTAIVLALLAAGCGGTQHVDRYAEVQPCLATLGLVGVEKIPADPDTGEPPAAIETATISYRSPGSGARETQVVFYAGKKQRAANRTPAPGRPGPIDLGDTASAWFASEPSATQREQLLACFD